MGDRKCEGPNFKIFLTSRWVIEVTTNEFEKHPWLTYDLVEDAIDGYLLGMSISDKFQSSRWIFIGLQQNSFKQQMNRCTIYRAFKNLF